MSRSIGLLAALALVTAPAGAQEPTQTGRIWKGTLGGSAITACFEEEFIRDGLYYVDSAVVLIRLAKIEGSDPPAFAEVEAGDAAAGATWTLQRTEGVIEGERSNGAQGDEETLAIRLMALPVALAEYGSACETAAFLDPLLVGGEVISKRDSFEGTAYTVLEYQGPKRAGLEDYAVSYFALDPARPGDDAINRALAGALPDGTASHVMGQCAGMSLPGGIGGYIEVAWVPVTITARWLGIRRSGSSYCGGAHPNHFLAASVYDRDSGAEVDPSRWFKPGTLAFYDFESEVDPKPVKRPVAGLSEPLATAVRAHWPKQGPAREDASECGLPEGLGGTQWDIGLTRKGPVFVHQLPYVIFACTEEVVVPWSMVRPFLSKEGRAVEASLRRNLGPQGRKGAKGIGRPPAAEAKLNRRRRDTRPSGLMQRSDRPTRTPHERGFRIAEAMRAQNTYLPKGPELARRSLRTLPGIHRLANAMRFDVAPTK